MAIVDYYLSLNSPWTFLGAQRFAEIVKQHDVIVRTKPTNFGEVFCGNRRPAIAQACAGAPSLSHDGTQAMAGPSRCADRARA